MAEQVEKKAPEKAKPAKKKDGFLKKASRFFKDLRSEVKKVVWPTRKEVTTTCVAVLVLVFVMSLFLGLVDFGLSRLVAFILS